jgi:hypothetical protein
LWCYVVNTCNIRIKWISERYQNKERIWKMITTCTWESV